MFLCSSTPINLFVSSAEIKMLTWPWKWPAILQEKIWENIHYREISLSDTTKWDGFLHNTYIKGKVIKVAKEWRHR